MALKEPARIRHYRRAGYVEQEHRLLTQTERSTDSSHDEREIAHLSFQIPRTTTATETRPPTRRSRGAAVAAVAPAVVRRAAPTWPAVRPWRRREPAAGPARPRRPEARAPSRTTPPSRRRTSISPDGRTARISGGMASGRVYSRRSAGRQRALRQRPPYHEETPRRN